MNLLTSFHPFSPIFTNAFSVLTTFVCFKCLIMIFLFESLHNKKPGLWVGAIFPVCQGNFQGKTENFKGTNTHTVIHLQQELCINSSCRYILDVLVHNTYLPLPGFSSLGKHKNSLRACCKWWTYKEVNILQLLFPPPPLPAPTKQDCL